MEYYPRTPQFKFVDGPPFVSSETLHYGHILVSCVKSAILHYKYMRGYGIQNTIGYDCHGLPIEMRMNTALGLKTVRDVEAYGTDKYHIACKDFIQMCQSSWTPIYRSIGRVVDEMDIYRTVDEPFMRTVWRVFKELWDAGLVSQGRRVVPYSIACGTALSNFEASQNYKEVVDTAVYWRFPLIGEGHAGEWIVVWTTTPWTLPANFAVCVGADIEYTLVHIGECNYWVATDRIEAFVKTICVNCQSDVHILYTALGKYFTKQSYIGMDGKTPRKIVADAYVSTETGTGFVHIAPEFGEDDLRIASANEIECQFDYIDDNGIVQRGEYTGKNVLDTSRLILRLGGDTRDLVGKEAYKHTYPFCWRTDTPLIYRAINSIFIQVSRFRDTLVTYNKDVKWMPDFVGTRRFADWLEHARDWGISRARIFGTPIPIWKSESGEYICVDEAEIEGDLHRDKIDDIVIKRNGVPYRRIPDVFDCWFESGCVPFVVGNDQADVIVEGLDQTRGWFYTLMVLWGALRRETPYKAVVTCGLILAQDGKKMSKRLNNFVDARTFIEQYGGDVMRIYLLGSPATMGESFRFDEKDMVKQLRRLDPYKNAVAFWTQFGKGYTEETNTVPLCDLDWWILKEINDLQACVCKHMDTYEVKYALDRLLGFVDTLCNKYIRFMRDRIRANGSYILWKVLHRYTLLLTPFATFTAEKMWKELGCTGHPLQTIMKGDDITVSGINYDRYIAVPDMLLAIEKVRQLRDLKKVPAKKPITCAELDMAPLEGDCLDIFLRETNVMTAIWNSDACNINSEETEEVINEYILRLMKREVYNKRKEWNLKITDKTSFALSGNSLYEFAQKNMARMEEMFGEHNGPALNKFGNVNIDIKCGRSNISVNGTIYLYKYGRDVSI